MPLVTTGHLFMAKRRNLRQKWQVLFSNLNVFTRCSNLFEGDNADIYIIFVFIIDENMETNCKSLTVKLRIQAYLYFYDNQNNASQNSYNYIY